ncbi:hypothetical protein ElyMa_001043600 [Elysia marginata]|uniref:Uncharacterized protein n=1 Tax=Elysia marginata TaxID=1093978 RepID=A0AAV4HMI9_9GAST|nr:hypothetical protein ElyMa_001043600 [Elysia marginata]
MAEESSGPGGYIPVPVILEPPDDNHNEDDGAGGGSHSRDDKDQTSNSGCQRGENIPPTTKNSTSSSSSNNTCSNRGTANQQIAAAPTATNVQGNLRRRQHPGAGTAEESTPLTLRRCIQTPHGGASPEPGNRTAPHPSGAALLSVEEGDSNLEAASSVEGEACGGPRRISGCSTGSAISSGTNPRAGQHHVVVVATPVPSPACGVPSASSGNAKSCPGDAPDEGGPDNPQRPELQGAGDHDNHDNNNNSNDSEDGEQLLFPGFAPKTFYVLDQKNYFRLCDTENNEIFALRASKCFRSADAVTAILPSTSPIMWHHFAWEYFLLVVPVISFRRTPRKVRVSKEGRWHNPQIALPATESFVHANLSTPRQEKQHSSIAKHCTLIQKSSLDYF